MSPDQLRTQVQQQTTADHGVDDRHDQRQPCPRHGRQDVDPASKLCARCVEECIA